MAHGVLRKREVVWFRPQPWRCQAHQRFVGAEIHSGRSWDVAGGFALNSLSGRRSRTGLSRLEGWIALPNGTGRALRVFAGGAIHFGVWIS